MNLIIKEVIKMKVLVVVDMQNDFIDGALGTPEAQAILPAVKKKIAEFDGRVLSQETLTPLTISQRRRESACPLSIA